MDKKDREVDSIYNTKSLYLLNIKELRSIGRQLGVPSPASKSKEQLVDYILKIIYGEIEVPFRNNTGRPSKNEYDIDLCLDKIKKNSLKRIKNNEQTEKIKTDEYKYENGFKDISYKLVSSDSQKYDIEDNIETRIYCKIDNINYLRKKGFIKSDDDIEISQTFASRYNLADKDIVEIIKCGEYFKIYSINGVKLGNNKPISVGNNVAYWGRCQDFYLSTKDEIKQEINIIKDWCNKKDVVMAVLGCNNFDGENVFSMNYSTDEENTQVYKKLVLFLDKCESLALNGENIIIVFEDKFYIESIIQSFDEDVKYRIKKHLYEVLDNIVKVGNICINYKVKTDFKY